MACAIINGEREERTVRLHLGKTEYCLGLASLILCIVLGSSCTQSNNHPVIRGVQSQKDWVATSGSGKIECFASDADGDSLTYLWSATGGTFSGAGPVVTWTAPDKSGTYAITVKVTDGKGGEATGQLTIDVLGNHAPVIVSLNAKPPEVNQGETTTIECVAYDPDGDELSFEWVATEGNFFGQGTKVNWIAPKTCGDFDIAVTVADGRGKEAVGELTIEVKKPG